MLRLLPPVWTIIYLLAGAALSWALGWPRFAGLWREPLGIGLVALAFIPPLWALALFHRADTEIEPTSKTNRVLVTEGPYRLTRNPMYLGLVTLSLGVALWVGAWPMLLAPVAIFLTLNFVHIPFEEAKMRRQFGAAYDAYVARVRRWV